LLLVTFKETSGKFYCIVWQSILHFSSQYLQKIAGNSFLDLGVTLSHVVDCTSEFCWWNWRPSILSAFLKCKDYDFRVYRLTSPVSENDTDLFLRNEESYNPRPVRIICYHKHNLDRTQSCLWFQLLHSVAGERNVISFLVIGQVYENCCHNMRDILLWINGLRKNIAPLVLVVLIGHHGWTLIACNGISGILWVPVSTEMKQTSRLNTTRVESIFQAFAQWRYQFTQFGLASPSKYVAEFANNTFLYKGKAPLWGNGLTFLRWKSVCCFKSSSEIFWLSHTHTHSWVILFVYFFFLWGNKLGRNSLNISRRRHHLKNCSYKTNVAESVFIWGSSWFQSTGPVCLSEHQSP